MSPYFFHIVSPMGNDPTLRSQNKLALVEGFSRGNSLLEFPAMPAVLTGTEHLDLLHVCGV